MTEVTEFSAGGGKKILPPIICVICKILWFQIRRELNFFLSYSGSWYRGLGLNIVSHFVELLSPERVISLSLTTRYVGTKISRPKD
jgi:hypothetical protein